MSDLSTSERRLISALDRLDFTVERAGDDLQRLRSRPAPAAPTVTTAGAQASLAAMQAENRKLSDDLAALHDRQAATLDAMRARLAETQERLAGAGEHAARLAAANDGLTAANRALMDAAGDWPGKGEAAFRAALEAEVESLRGARAAEIAQMGEILDALDRMLGTPAPKPRKPVREGAQAAVPAAAAARDGAEGAAATDAPSLATATEVSEPDAVIGDADPAEKAGDHELTVEREDIPDDDVSLFGGVYDDDDGDPETQDDDLEGELR
ncbi:hypothetical protein KTN05_10675 [Paracoccus sp. Z118]|uniref:hypothetical protein n=1 Tax=Paracoccus sp. Z118 TaxID=2851017 RepID=UPI001C2BCE58|nr:hypothetical protein [Paracoccus sp. Z118]MBV0892314.1 hypothetical protein [Paracoccus sp. Z118]